VNIETACRALPHVRLQMALLSITETHILAYISMQH